MSDGGSWQEEVSKLKKVISELLEDPAWEKSFILRRKKKDISEAIAEVSDCSDALQYQQSEQRVTVENQDKKILQDDSQLVYVVLHQTKGNEIALWQRALHAIDTCGFGRPIYEKQEFARQLVACNGARDADGYVEVLVKKKDVIQPTGAASQVDKLEQPVVNIRPGGLHCDRILKFVHHNDINYLLVNGKLVLDES